MTNVYYPPDNKLDLPATAADFGASVGGANQNEFRFRNAIQAAASAGGTAVCDFGMPPIGYYWMIERIVVKGAGTVNVYIAGVADVNIADFTAAGSGDVADEASPIFVPIGQDFSVVFTGAGAGTLCTATVQGKAIRAS